MLAADLLRDFRVDGGKGRDFNFVRCARWEHGNGKGKKCEYDFFHKSTTLVT
jgi:hypothetical protein